MEVQELIVVEGKDDVAAVKHAIQAEVIATCGYGFKAEFVEILKAAVKRTGVIIFTDPDSAGNQIRRKLNASVPGCKNAYLSQTEGLKGGKIGIEYASAESIRLALEKSCTMRAGVSKFTMSDLVDLGLGGGPGAVEKRKEVGILLGIGETNSKQFLNRLNHQQISSAELLAAINNAGGN